MTRAIDVSLRIKVEIQRTSKSSWPPSKSSLISRNEEIYTEGAKGSSCFRCFRWSQLDWATQDDTRCLVETFQRFSKFHRTRLPRVWASHSFFFSQETTTKCCSRQLAGMAWMAWVPASHKLRSTRWVPVDPKSFRLKNLSCSSCRLDRIRIRWYQVGADLSRTTMTTSVKKLGWKRFSMPLESQEVKIFREKGWG